MGIKIRQAGPDDADDLHDALMRLSSDIGEKHESSAEVLARAGWGAHPSFRALLAEDEAAVTVGAAVYSAIYSTVRGGAGVYVSDLWVAPGVRRHGLGQRLLTAVLDDAGERWDAIFLKLSVYDRNEEARNFYTRMGFIMAVGQNDMILEPDTCAVLKGGVS